MHSELQRMTFHTSSLAARRACATGKDWPHLFRGTQPIGGTRSGSANREKRQLLIGAALGPSLGASSGTRSATGSRILQRRLQEDMALLRNYTAVLAVFAAKIRTRFDKEFLIQSAITELGSHIAIRRGHLEVGQWAPPHAAPAHRRGSPPHLDKVDEGAAPRAALRGGSAVGAACFLPP